MPVRNSLKSVKVCQSCRQEFYTITFVWDHRVGNFDCLAIADNMQFKQVPFWCSEHVTVAVGCRTVFDVKPLIHRVAALRIDGRRLSVCVSACLSVRLSFLCLSLSREWTGTGS